MFEREILRSWGGSWLRFRLPFGHLLGASGRLGPHLRRLGPHFGAKVPTRRQPHHPTKKTRKPWVPKSEIGGTGAYLWGRGKTADSDKNIAKVSLNTGENANPAKWRKHGVNQGR